jgi:Domain of unknown function (DUF6473)
MGQGYQDRDYEIVDYQLYNLEGIPRPFRGPKPKSIDKENFLTCVGAAQTFGCYCENPYPMALQKELGLPTLNFGVAGAGPSFFTTRPAFMKRINEAKFAIIQIMSGRSESNSLFESKGGEMLLRHSDNKTLGAAPAYRELLATKDYGLIYEILLETRRNWVRNYIKLLNDIKIPKILFWFSVRSLDYTLDFNDVHKFFGEFPQFVTSEMVEILKKYSDEYVECVSNRGLPQPLFSRFTGKPFSITKRKDLGGGKKTHNDYYPSPEMHEDATALLVPVCRKFSH